MPLRSELHCHNVFSNFNVGEMEAPYDCGVTIESQIERAYAQRLDAIFVTNHNTLDGYKQLRRYAADHKKFEKILVMPGEEVTTQEGSHVIAYGLHEPIKPGLGFEEVVDEIRRQDAVSSAPHPFSILDALREKSKSCDLIEVFNSNSVDLLANARAEIFAMENGLTGVAGSDAHVSSAIGRCTNLIDSEGTMDDVLAALRHGRIRVENTGYATAQETIEHLRYKISNSSEYVQQYMAQFYPRSRHLFSILLRLFELSPDSYLWVMLYRFAIFAMKRISNKINFQGEDAGPMRERDIGTMLRMAL